MPSTPLDFAPDAEAAQFAPVARGAIGRDSRRIVIVGAGGWIGRAALALLHEALGPDQAQRRIFCFGSQARTIEIESGIAFPQRPLSELAALPCEPTLLFHLAFLTKDKVGDMDDAEYARVNRMLSQQVLDVLPLIGVDRLFVASSGAAAFADDPAAAHDLKLYGGLKRIDEDRFARWAAEAPDVRRALITRIYNISGPYINKHETYALASFILDALAARPIEVRAPMRVIRGFVAVRELLSLVFAALLAESGEAVLRFDSGGEALELGDVAARVAEALGGGIVQRRPITGTTENRYAGDDARYRELIGQFGIDHVPLARQITETASYLSRIDRAMQCG